MKLTVHNPVQEAIRQTRGLNAVQVGNNWNTQGFCWSCGKDKPKKGGRVTGFRAPGSRAMQGNRRFTCADCLNAKGKA